MIGLAEGCRWIEAKFIEDEDREFDYVATVLLDRWGDRRVPSKQPNHLGSKAAEGSLFDPHSFPLSGE